MDFTPKFITVDDFNNYWSRDLNAMLRSNSNESNAGNNFLTRVEDRLMNWIDSNTFRTYRWDCLTPYQLELFRKALLTQAMYMYNNGDLGIDSGYDGERGVVIKRSELVMLEVAPAALDLLKNAGLFTQKMRNYRRTMKGWGTTLGYFGSFRNNEEGESN